MSRLMGDIKYLKNDILVSFFNTLDIGVHILDKNGITILYNSKCEEIEGIENSWIVGSDMKLLVSEGVYSESVGLEAIEKLEPVSKAQRVNNKYIYSTARPVFKGQDLAYVVISVLDMTNIEELKTKLRKLEDVNVQIIQELDRLKNSGEVNLYIEKSKVMEGIYDLSKRVAQVDSSILIGGESGVGKGVLSKYIHDHSPRKDKPFVKIDCGSLTPSLIESELFGYEEGSFTGAKKEGRKGLIELAHGGTLFLDEIGELPLNLQVKLLTVIQDKKVQKVGGNDYIDVDIRIISASNRDLYKMVEEKTFRMDLYYRLKVVDIRIPSIRERKEDIVAFTNHFLNKFNEEYKLNKSIDPEAMKILIEYNWPGNIREIENEIERLMVTSTRQIIAREDVEGLIINKAYDIKLGLDKDYKDIMRDYEIFLLKEYGSQCKNMKELSELSGLDESTLRKKAKRFNMEIEFRK